MQETRQEWRTPPDFIEVIKNRFPIGWDVAASAEDTVTEHFFSKEDDGLRCRWFHDASCVWCNPGFSNLGAWVDKAITEVSLVPHGVALVMGLVSPSSKWWARAEHAGAEIRLLSPRVQFLPPPGIKASSNARENALLIFRSVEHRDSGKIWTWQWKPRKTSV